MSNKMPIEQPEKTVSARKFTASTRRFIYLIAILVLFVLVAISAKSMVRRNDNCRIKIFDINSPDNPLKNIFSSKRADYKCLKLEQVSSPGALKQGLSGRISMPEDQGMLFVFDRPSRYCFWMKDMRFPIDIIWLSADKKVLEFAENVEPKTYPNNFCPAQPAQFVIEVNAGVAREVKLEEGKQLQF